MKLRSLNELQEVDDRAQVFTPLGLALSGALSVDDAVRHHQEAIADADLGEAVPTEVRRTFERLREMYSCGLLYYDLFTVAGDLSNFVIEQALGERFIEHYGGEIPFVDKKDEPMLLVAERFRDVYKALHDRGGSHRKAKFLVVNDGQGRLEFRGGFRDLLKWARREGLLRGQRNRFRESVWVDIRNEVAHPSGYHLVGPPDSARDIREVAEIIKFLWGQTTPGGRLFPGLVSRDIIDVAWDEKAGSFWSSLAKDLASGPPDLMYVFVRGVWPQDEFFGLDTEFETTAYPTEVLWGPGTRSAAIAWITENHPEGDETEYFDRWFFIRQGPTGLDRPRSPSAAAAVSTEEPETGWFLVQADHPADAHSHARSIGETSETCDPVGPCGRCSAATMASGALEDIRAIYESVQGPITLRAQNRVQVPGRWSADMSAQGISGS